MTRTHNYKGYTIGTDNLGRDYIHDNSNRYWDDIKVIGVGCKLSKIKQAIDSMIDSGYDNTLAAVSVIKHFAQR